MKLKNVALSGALACGMLTAAAPAVLANDDDGPPATTCPTTATFPFVFPVGTGLPFSGGGSIVTFERPGQLPGQCVGVLVVFNGTTPVGVGVLVANHSGADVSATFFGVLLSGGTFKGTLLYSGAASEGATTVQVSTAGICLVITSPFTGDPVTGFLPGTPVVASC